MSIGGDVLAVYSFLRNEGLLAGVLYAIKHLDPERRARLIRAMSKDHLSGRTTKGVCLFVVESLEAQAMQGISKKTPNGLRVTARSGKELRRFTNEKDPKLLEWMRSFEPGEVFYDIGANVGGLTLAVAALHGEAVRIVAIEPSFGSFESLARNLSNNGLLGFVIPLQVALL